MTDQQFISYIVGRTRWEIMPTKYLSYVNGLMNTPSRNGVYNKSWANAWAEAFIIAKNVLDEHDNDR